MTPSKTCLSMPLKVMHVGRAHRSSLFSHMCAQAAASLQ